MDDDLEGDVGVEDDVDVEDDELVQGRKQQQVYSHKEIICRVKPIFYILQSVSCNDNSISVGDYNHGMINGHFFLLAFIPISNIWGKSIKSEIDCLEFSEI